MPADGAGFVTFPAGRVIVLSATIRRADRRCDYPAGRWVLQVEADPLVDGTPMGAQAVADSSEAEPINPGYTPTVGE